jgi:prolyl 4-hydroxylase
MLTRLTLISNKPRILQCNKFLSDLECDRMIELGKKRTIRFPGTTNYGIFPFEIDEDKTLDDKTKGFLRSIENRVAAITGTPSHDDELGLQLQFTEPEKKKVDKLNLGLHVDTNKRYFRFATALIYLNTLPEEHDGQTVFPLVGLADSSPMVQASKKLLQEHIEHTDSAFNPFEKSPSIYEAGNQILKHSKEGFHVRPEKGKLILFYSRDVAGDVDPYGWHGGSAVLGTGKWTMQKFKEVPKEFRRNEEDFRNFIRDRHDIVVSSSGAENYIVEQPKNRAN